MHSLWKTDLSEINCMDRTNITKKSDFLISELPQQGTERLSALTTQFLQRHTQGKKFRDIYVLLCSRIISNLHRFKVYLEIMRLITFSRFFISSYIVPDESF